VHCFAGMFGTAGYLCPRYIDNPYQTIFVRQKLCLLREPTESAHTEAVGETNL
jgi:hypothetical protein